MERITKEYVHGTGDLGFSSVLLNQPPLRKDSPPCGIQGAIEKARHKIELTLCLPVLHPDKYCSIKQQSLLDLLNWLDKHIFSLASFCYCGGNSTKHLFPISLLTQLREETARVKNSLENCKDFLYQSHPLLVYLDGVRIEIRELERAYISWWYSKEVIQSIAVSDSKLDQMFIKEIAFTLLVNEDRPGVNLSWWKSKRVQNLLDTEDSLIKKIVQNSAILNALSAYMFSALRMEAHLLSQEISLQEQYWSAEIEPFYFQTTKTEYADLPG